MRKFANILLSFALMLMFSSVVIAKTDQVSAIEKRLQPVGQILLKEDVAKVVAAVGVASLSPQQIYNKHCTVCHATGLLGAPKFQNIADWKPRVAAGMPDMLEKAVKGFKAMPPMGTCMECSKEQMQAAIKYMSEKP